MKMRHRVTTLQRHSGLKRPGMFRFNASTLQRFNGK